MPTANIVSLCQGVVDALNGGAFDEVFTATFEYLPNYSPMNVKTLRVVVTDAGGRASLASRRYLLHQDSISVVVIWRIDAGGTGLDTALMNRALVLMDQIANFLIQRPIAGYAPEGIIRRGQGDTDKQHYMKGDLEERVFAASFIIAYQSKELIEELGS